MRVRERPRFKLSRGGRLRRLRGRRGGRAGDLAVGPPSVELPPARRARGGDVRRRRGRGDPRPRLRVGATTRSDGRWSRRWRSPAAHGGEVRDAGKRRGRANEAEGAVEDWRSRLPADPLPARHVRRLRRALRDLRDGDHLGPLRGLPRRGDGRRPGGRSPRSRGAPAEGPGSARVSCRFTHVYPDGPAPYFTVIAPAVRGGEVEQWDEIKAAVSEAVIEGGGTITHHHAVGPRPPPLV